MSGLKLSERWRERLSELEVPCVAVFLLTCHWFGELAYHGLRHVPVGTLAVSFGLMLLFGTTYWLSIVNRFHPTRSFREFAGASWNLRTPQAVVAATFVTFVLALFTGNDMLASWLALNTNDPVAFDWHRAWPLALLVIVVAWIARRERLAAPIDRNRARGAPQAGPVKKSPNLVWFLSDPPAKLSNVRDVKSAFQFAGIEITFVDLDADLAGFARGAAMPYPHAIRWNWEQFLRAIAYHRGVLSRIYLITSDVSIIHLPFLQQVLRGYKETQSIELRYVGVGGTTRIPNPLPADWRESGIDFEDFEVMFHAVEEAVKDAGGVKNVVVDITGGQKPSTAAAVMFTVDRAMQAQYVQTGRDKKVIGYDLVYPPVPR